MAKRTIRMVRSKETKNKTVFAEDVPQGNLAIVQTLYLEKWFVGDATEIEVSINTTPEHYGSAGWPARQDMESSDAQSPEAPD